MTKNNNGKEHEVITWRGKRIWVCNNHFCDKDGTSAE